MTATASLPSAIRAHVAPSAIDRVTRFFNATLGDSFVELIQNARRSQPTRISVTTQPLARNRTLIAFSDDGCGIADPSVLLAFGRSGWDRATADAEDPAGIGVYALSQAGCTVASRPRGRPGDLLQGWRARIGPECFLGKCDAPVTPDEAAPLPHGTCVSFVTDQSEGAIRTALSHAAEHCPIQVHLDGTQLDRRAFLDGAVHAEKWNGIVFGVFDRDMTGFSSPDLNFHGLTLHARLPSVETIDDGVWSVRADIDSAPDLELVLPARKELVETPFASDMRAAARTAIYRAMRRADRSPSLPYNHYRRARDAGIDMQIAAAVLRPWRPSTADHNDWHNPARPEPVRPSTLVMAADLEPQDAQALWRALERAGLQHRVFEADPRCEGYSWYDSLARLTAAAFDIDADGASHDLDSMRNPGDGDPPSTDPGHPRSIARPDEIHACITIEKPDGHSEALILPTDVAFAGDAWCHAQDTRPLVTRDSDLTPGDLADLLYAGFFSPSEDCGDDSWETQRDRFQQDAMHIAVRLLASEDEARKHTIADAVWREIFWVLPKDRDVSITVADRKVSVEFGPAPPAPEGIPA